MTLDEIDKSNLILESYRIKGITDTECRSIFADWAFKLPVEISPQDAIALLLQTYESAAPDHPMSVILRDGLATPASPRRRGGRSARVPNT